MDENTRSLGWYPGHMAKTRRILSEKLAMVDGVVELRDARIPASSENPILAQLIAEKPRVIILAKADLAQPDATEKWMAALRGGRNFVFAADCKSGRGLSRFAPTVKQALTPTLARNAARGMPGKPLRLMVVGIPNTGKSSLINRLAGRVKAVAADRPGVTRSTQWVPVGKIGPAPLELLDTPGVLWPKLTDMRAAERLAFLGALKDTILDTQALAQRFITCLTEAEDLERLHRRYGALQGGTPHTILEGIARGRGFLCPGGVPDTPRAALTLLDELRAGKLGRITLDEI
jgi:ribosome biogenesis GTPase A